VALHVEEDAAGAERLHEPREAIGVERGRSTDRRGRARGGEGLDAGQRDEAIREPFDRLEPQLPLALRDAGLHRGDDP
jgi:hypothetical protein